MNILDDLSLSHTSLMYPTRHLSQLSLKPLYWKRHLSQIPIISIFIKFEHPSQVTYIIIMYLVNSYFFLFGTKISHQSACIFLRLGCLINWPLIRRIITYVYNQDNIFQLDLLQTLIGTKSIPIFMNSVNITFPDLTQM